VLHPASWPSISVLGFPLDVVTLEQAARWVVAAASGDASSRGPCAGISGRMAVAVSFNPELVTRAQKDPIAAEILWEADLSYPDGVGAAWAAGRQGTRSNPDSPAIERVAGIDLAERVLEFAAELDCRCISLEQRRSGRRGCPPVGRTSPRLCIAGAHHGYFASADEDAVVRAVRESGPVFSLWPWVPHARSLSC
jgi:N-acetylglucosaminyldiphosphoundecaprenol N-acetyl-beta-D-mannosaminyltransferase